MSYLVSTTDQIIVVELSKENNQLFEGRRSVCEFVDGFYPQRARMISPLGGKLYFDHLALLGE